MALRKTGSQILRYLFSDGPQRQTNQTTNQPTHAQTDTHADRLRSLLFAGTANNVVCAWCVRGTTRTE
jgi:hypothetical protein